jgi:wobble nucleotide-excising tRNase
VIVGKQGVGLALEEERLAGESRGKGGEIKTAEKTLQSHLPQGMKLDDFLKLPADPEIDAKIAAQTKALEAVREAAQLKARPPLTEAPFPTLPPAFEATLGKTLAGIAEDAQKRIAEHISHHSMSKDAETWIAEGVNHISGDSCPFCGQSLKGLALIEAYRTVFAETYREAKAEVANVCAAIERDFGDRVIGVLETLIESNRSGAEFWSRYCKLPELNAPVEASKAISMIREAAVYLLSRKSAAPLDVVAIDLSFSFARERYEAARGAIEKYNGAVKAGNAEIAAKKTAVAGGDLKKEEAVLARLTAQKKRHDPKVASLCTVHQTLTKEKEALDTKKAAVRSKLEEHTK